MSILRCRVVVATTAVMLFLSGAASAVSQGGKWIEAWYSPPFPPTAALAFGDVRIFAHQTVRQVVRLDRKSVV